MGKFGSIDEVLEFAVDREIEANQLYKDLAARAENPTMRKVFEDFARTRYDGLLVPSARHPGGKNVVMFTPL